MPHEAEQRCQACKKKKAWMELTSLQFSHPESNGQWWEHYCQDEACQLKQEERELELSETGQVDLLVLKTPKQKGAFI